MKSRTALVYSERYQDHDTGHNHPERPARVISVYQFLKKSDLFPQLLLIRPRPAHLRQVNLVHPLDYIHHVKHACQRQWRLLDTLDTAISPESFDVALLAVGGVLELVDAIMAGEARNGFALVRPPGHHAEPTKALGFCIFNNVAIAARYLQEEYGLERILIIDWDVHHGNGTQHIFEEDPSVFYFSTHQYPFYPGTGAESEIGRGQGKGTTLNVPLPAGAGDEEYQSVFREIFYPRAIEFMPDFILISAGFDAHEADPLAHMNLTESSYGFFTDMALQIAHESGHERVASVLEGGYHLEMTSRSVYIHLKHLMALSPLLAEI
ncbi:MAG: histone deacetylase [Candidatus Omnitrophica bacterium]|nr:histone deacetylase [Candidatus Omnitrophota bacterium]